MYFRASLSFFSDKKNNKTRFIVPIISRITWKYKPKTFDLFYDSYLYFRVLALDLSTDRVASGSSDKTVRIWCIYTGNLQQTFYGHQRGVWCVRFFTQNIVISGSYDTTIRVSIQNKLLKKNRKQWKKKGWNRIFFYVRCSSGTNHSMHSTTPHLYFLL